MIKSKFLKFVPVLCLSVACMTGCSGGGGSAVGSVATSGVDGYAESASYSAYDSKSMDTMDNSIDTEMVSDDVNPIADEQAKRIYSGNITLETTSFMESQNYLYECIASAKGYLESDNTNKSATYFSDDVALYTGDMTIRVPAKNFDTLVDAVEKCDKAVVADKSVHTDDISEVYYDTESRLKSYKIKLETLQDLLSKAENVTEILDIENAITSTQYEIENLQGQLNHYDSQADYSVLYITLREVNVLSLSNKAAGYGSKLRASVVQGFDSGVNFISNLILFVLQGWLLYLIFGIVIYVIYKKTKPKRDARRAEKQAIREEELAVRRILTDGAAEMDNQTYSEYREVTEEDDTVE